ncbi:MAG: S41 family peptidase [Paludibacteraceae bacterium]|nr:S41 family peptidase [Paludibacteraceae bacterium]
MKHKNLFLMKKIYLPILVGFCIALGIVIGVVFTENSYKNFLGQISLSTLQNTKLSKTDVIFKLIDEQYVDSIDTQKIEESIIPEIFKHLDPHSSYIPAKDIEEVNADLSGSFSGIGVQFNLQNDTIYIVDVIRGGPSERAGLVAGDRIVEVNDTIFVGKEINNEKIVKKLRGPKNTKVKIGVKRRGTKEILHYTIVRDDIPVKSVESAYMITPNIGYIYVSKFGATTYNEFLTSIAMLKKQGANKFIIDLRGNSGGYLDAATRMINEFLYQGQLIVYTQGNPNFYPRSDIYAIGTGSCKSNEIAVLVDEFSGSASEIFAGAIQDNDRGIIIGRRTFGKGLVQQQIPLEDNSALRLTVARYYTPSGRCIQKPYELGKIDEYEKDILNRYEHGEFYSQDSIKQDTIAYKTLNGRTVYSGGGIMPDIFVPSDTSDISPFFTKLFNSGTMYKFALRYTENNREILKKQGNWMQLSAYLDTQNILKQTLDFAEKQNIIGSERDKKISNNRIKKQVYAYIVRDVLGDDGFYPILNKDDKCVQIAIEKIQNQDELNRILNR